MKLKKQLNLKADLSAFSTRTIDNKFALNQICGGLSSQKQNGNSGSFDPGNFGGGNTNNTDSGSHEKKGQNRNII